MSAKGVTNGGLRQRLKNLPRVQKHAELYADGKNYSYRDIQRMTGWSKDTVHRDIRMAIDAKMAEAGDVVVGHLTGYLTECLNALHSAATQQGDTKSIDSAVKVIARMSKMLGLDAPEKRDEAPTERPVVEIRVISE